MEQFARKGLHKKILLFPFTRPFSCFSFVDHHFKQSPPIKRILSQARMNQAKTMVCELLHPTRDISEEDEDISKRISNFRYSVAYRLSFFTKKITKTCCIRRLSAEDFIGYAIVKNEKFGSHFQHPRIYESVIKSSRHDNNFTRGEQIWECRVNNSTFPVHGYLYAQQNDLTNVCAHVAVRTAAARFHKNGDMLYREMNNFLGIDHEKRKVGGGHGGLNVDELTTLLEEAGASCYVADYTSTNTTPEKLPFEKRLYGSIESGFPAIVAFKCAAGDYHAIPLFGHTLNQDTWVHRANISYFKIGTETIYIPSESWWSTYLGHDDNWGSNFCIPRRYFYTRTPCNYPSGGNKGFCDQQEECVAFVISTMPKKVMTDPVRAEVLGAGLLFSILKLNTFDKNDETLPWDNEWLKRLKNYCKVALSSKRPQLVLRSILIRANQYAKHLSRIKDWDGDRIQSNFIKDIKEWNTEEWIWMIEFSVPELFSANMRKLGEVILKAEVPPNKADILDSFIMARIPGHFIVRNVHTSQFEYLPCGAEGHVELFGCEEA